MKNIAKYVTRGVRKPMKISPREKMGQVFAKKPAQATTVHGPVPQRAEYNKNWHVKTLNGDAPRLALDAALPTETRAMMAASGVSPFPGYPFLQYMSQNALISAGVETTADEMTREFAKIVYNGKASDVDDVDDSEKVQDLEADMKSFDVRAVFCRAAEMIGYYGGCLVYIDNGVTDSALLRTPLYLDSKTFRKNSLKNLVVVDPINCSPGVYNASDPTQASYFVPETWLILGKEVHKSRILYFCGKEAPLLYKPAYNFFGISSSQLALEYVENFTGNKESASRLLDNFSTTVLKTNMMGVLQGDGVGDLQARLGIFIEERNNNGVFALDKEEEDLVKVDTSISGVTDIVRQALELIASVFRIPAVKFLGISPSGFNATGESDIKNFYDFIASCQQKQLGQNLEMVLKILQLNRYGNIDKNLSMEWCALSKSDGKAKADTQKVKIDGLVALYDRQLVSDAECRKVLAEDKDGDYSFLTSEDDNADGDDDDWGDLDSDGVYAQGLV